MHVVAVAAVIVKEGRFLAMRRAAHAEAGAGLWETCSGRLEAGEEPIDAITREVVEETGLDVAFDPRPLDAYAARRRGAPMIVVVYRAEWVGGEVVRSEEHDAHAWWTIDEARASNMPLRLIEAVARALPSHGLARPGGTPEHGG